jgi:RimJ/RimL family protein N-acetyltransferase
MVGLHRVASTYPFAPAVEIGWRLHPAHWGRGYATEAAEASRDHGFAGGLDEIVAFTAAGNLRSQAVMRRIGMARDPAADFDHPALPEDSPLRSHVLYRVRSGDPETTGA